MIGGSIARAVRVRAPIDERWSIVAWSPSGRGPAAALGDGVVDAAATSIGEAVDEADLVVLAVPPLVCLDLLSALADPGTTRLAPGMVVTDVSSTKRAIVDRASELVLPFVGGHPMAGSERSGFAASVADLFVDRPWIVTPATDSALERVELVERLARICGARPVRMDAAAHDRAVAAVSHLPLLLSAALVETAVGGPDWSVAAELASSGWRDMTRLARGDAAMAAGIAATNPAELAVRARDLRTVLDRWIASLERQPSPDAAELRSAFAAARAALVGGGEDDDRSDGG